MSSESDAKWPGDRAAAHRWLIAFVVLAGGKLAITAWWIAQRHHVVTLVIPRDVENIMWWFTKLSPFLFVPALIMYYLNIGNVVFARFFLVLFPLIIVYGSVVIYAMLHGWHGLPL